MTFTVQGRTDMVNRTNYGSRTSRRLLPKLPLNPLATILLAVMERALERHLETGILLQVAIPLQVKIGL